MNGTAVGVSKARGRDWRRIGNGNVRHGHVDFSGPEATLSGDGGRFRYVGHGHNRVVDESPPWWRRAVSRLFCWQCFAVVAVVWLGAAIMLNAEKREAEVPRWHQQQTVR